jgi:hypothetical protein
MLASAAWRSGQVRPVLRSSALPASSSNMQPHNCARPFKSAIHWLVRASRAAGVRLRRKQFGLVNMTAGAPPPFPPPGARRTWRAWDGPAGSRVRTSRHATAAVLHASGQATDLPEHGHVQTKSKYRDKYHHPEISHDLSFACQSESSEVPTSNLDAMTPGNERTVLAKCLASRVLFLEDGDLIKCH